MARKQIESASQCLARVVLTQGLDILGGLVGVLVAHQKADDHVTEGVIHSRVELRALQIATKVAIADLVGGVFPDLAEQQCIGFLGEHGLFDLGQEVVGKLVGHVQTPAMGASAQPLTNDAVLAQKFFTDKLGILVDGGHVAHTPPAVIRTVLMEVKRIAPRRILTLPCTDAGIVAVAVKVDRVVARMVEDAVQDDGNAKLLGRLTQLGKVLLGAQDRVYLGVIGRVVAVVARGLKDRVEVDGRKAQLGNAGQVILDTLERAAVKIPGLDGSVLGTLILGRFVPVLDHAALDSVTRFFNFGKRAFAPVIIAGIAVGKDLVD